MFINHSSKEVAAKIVYYGPGLSGKTTNLQYIFSITNPKSRGELISIETEIERTLYFDLLPMKVGLLNGYQTKFQIYTVPGQIFYDSTRKLVLKGADGVIFVADSQEVMEEKNIESLENLKVNMAANRLDFNEIPLVFQYNKRDLPKVLPVDRLNSGLNPRGLPYFESCAKTGQGVLETLRKSSALILRRIKSLLDDQKPPPRTKLPPVSFDTDSHKAIIKKEHLPYKKVPLQGDPATVPVQRPKVTADEKEAFLRQEVPVPAAVETAPPKPAATGDNVSRMLEYLDQLKDETRATVIHEVPVAGNETQLEMEIRDSASGCLKTVRVDISPQTQKVTLVLDLKRPPRPPQ